MTCMITDLEMGIGVDFDHQPLAGASAAFPVEPPGMGMPVQRGERGCGSLVVVYDPAITLTGNAPKVGEQVGVWVEEGGGPAG